MRVIFMALALSLAVVFSPVLADSHTDDALFQLGDKKYAAGDLPQLLQQALYDAELKFYQEKQAMIDEALVVMEIEKRAKESGKSSDVIAGELFLADKPSDEAITAFYEQNKSRINQPLEAIKPQIAQLLLQQGQAAKQQVFLTGLKADSGFTLHLKKPEAPLSEIDVSGYPFKGPVDAKVVLVEFADYQCPHCKHAGDALKKVHDQFKDDLKLVFIDFPVNRSGISRKIAEGAACAAKQDKFWEYHDLAFSDQRALKADSAPAFAEKLGLDSSAFAECLASDYPTSHVSKGQAEGNRLGVNATPTLFLNGRKVALGDLENQLPEAIEQALATVK